MKLVLSDVSRDIINTDEDAVVMTAGSIHHCIGCFGCWVKTPGKCVIADEYEDMGRKLSRCDELILISECVYGSYSPFVKNVLDRSISYLHPNFCIRKGEMHHKRRYDNVITIRAYFYGEGITKREKDTAANLVRANAVNFDGNVGKIEFYNSREEIRSIQV